VRHQKGDGLPCMVLPAAISATNGLEPPETPPPSRKAPIPSESRCDHPLILASDHAARVVACETPGDAVPPDGGSGRRPRILEVVFFGDIMIHHLNKFARAYHLWEKLAPPPFHGFLCGPHNFFVRKFWLGQSRPLQRRGCGSASSLFQPGGWTPGSR